GPLELDASDAALGELAPGLVGDADLVARERLPARDDRHRVRAGRGREGDALRREARAIDAIDEHATPPWREREIERAFREAVHRRERLRVEAVLREARCEALHRVRAHRLRAVERPAPGRQVQPLELALVEPRRGELVREIRPGGDRAAI